MTSPAPTGRRRFFDTGFDDWADHTEDDAPPGPGRRRRRGTAVVVALAAALVGVALVGPAAASADPTADAWYRLRMCESSNNYAINTGNGYYGAYQFDLGTWRSVGGTGLPSQASPAEQDARALQLYRMRGWQPWTCATILGLRSDGDARSGRTVAVPAAPAPAAAAAATTTAPAWPGTYWSLGDDDPRLQAFQLQMARRGAALSGGTGLFGPITLATVKRLQAANGLPQTGLLGPITWKLAWNGTY